MVIYLEKLKARRPRKTSHTKDDAAMKLLSKMGEFLKKKGFIPDSPLRWHPDEDAMPPRGL
jgi:hypothetical protein